MKTRTLSLIAGIFVLGLSSIFGQEKQMHKNHSGHMAEPKNAEAPDAFKKQLTDVNKRLDDTTKKGREGGKGIGALGSAFGGLGSIVGFLISLL